MTPIMPIKLVLTSRISPPADITAFSVTEPIGRVLAAMCAQADCLIAWNGSIAHITPLDARPSASAIIPPSASAPMTRAQTLVPANASIIPTCPPANRPGTCPRKH